MRKNYQLIVDKGNGDCFRACLTSLLDIPNDPLLPTPKDPEWYLKWHKLLRQFGLCLKYNQTACWTEGFWIASVKSKNYSDVTHAIIMKDCKVYFDPSTKIRYKAGEMLLGEGIVLGGHSLIVTNPSKLHKLKQWSENYAKT